MRPAAYTATITDSANRQYWRSIMGADEVPIVSPLPELLCQLDDERNEYFYRVDLEALTNDQQARLIRHFSRQWHEPPDQVAANLHNGGCWIPANELSVPATNLTLFA